MLAIEQLTTLFRGEKVEEFMVEQRKQQECADAQTALGGEDNQKYKGLETLIKNTQGYMLQVLGGLRRYQNH